MGHVTHIECVTSTARCTGVGICISHSTRLNESVVSGIFHWVTSPLWRNTSHQEYAGVGLTAYESVITHIWMNRVTYMTEPRHTYWGTSPKGCSAFDLTVKQSAQDATFRSMTAKKKEKRNPMSAQKMNNWVPSRTNRMFSVGPCDYTARKDASFRLMAAKMLMCVFIMIMKVMNNNQKGIR